LAISEPPIKSLLQNYRDVGGFVALFCSSSEVEMGIQSTREISRERAIERITEIQRLAAAHDFVGIEAVSFEPDCDIREFVANAVLVNVERWTNGMLEELLDMPFYRHGMFDNYRVV
jgi:hypothetical protein